MIQVKNQVAIPIRMNGKRKKGRLKKPILLRMI